MAARYWRLAGIVYRHPSSLVLSAVGLHDGGSRLAGTLTSSQAPSGGSLAALQDDAEMTLCAFAGGSGALVLTWDFGTDVNVDGISVRSGDLISTYISHGTLQSSSDGVTWSSGMVAGRFAWPGPWADTGVKSLSPWVLSWSESFDTGIPAGFANVLTDAGSLAITYDSASQAVDLAATGYNTAWMFQGRAGLTELRVDIDAEIIDPDYGNSPYMGVVFAGGGNLSQSILSATNQTATTYMSGNAAAIGLQTAAATTLPLAQSTARAIRSVRMTGTAALRTVEMAVGSASVQHSQTNFTTGAAFQAGIYVRSCKIRVYGVSVYAGQAAAWLPLVPTAVADPAPRFTFSAPRPGAPSFSPPPQPQPSRSYLRAGKGVVRGVVVEDSNPDIPLGRIVRLYNELDGRLVDATWSDPVTGQFEFTQVDVNYKYTAVSYDYEGRFIAVLKNGIRMRDPMATDPDPLYADVVSLAEFTSDFSDARGLAWNPSSVTISDIGSGFGKGAFFSSISKLSLAVSECFNFSRGDYTVEMYVNVLSGSPASAILLSSGGAAWGAGQCAILFSADKVSVAIGGGTTMTAATAVAKGAWKHIAVCRKDGITRIFVGGILDYTSVYNIEPVNFSADGSTLGSSNSGGATLSGYIRGFRATAKGRYVSSFDPPPLPMPRPTLSLS